MSRFFISGLLIALACTSLSAAEEGRQVKKNVDYTADSKGTPAQVLDVFPVATGENHPIVIWIHGGGWRIGDKLSAATKVKPFNAHDVALVAINYRLVPNANYTAQAEDIATAIRWTYDHAAEFGGDQKQIYVMGHSAGAHLAALVATDERYLQQQKLELSNIKGVILLDGAGYDIPEQLKLTPFPLLRQMYIDAFTEDEGTQKAASPVTYIASGKEIPPFLIFYVASRRDGKIQSVGLGRKLAAAGVANEVVPAENKTHGTINKELGTDGDLPTMKVYEFISK